MKTILILLSAAFFAAQAQADVAGKLSCIGKPSDLNVIMTLQAAYFGIETHGISVMKDVVVGLYSPDRDIEPQALTGPKLESDADYRPTKYTDSVRFNLRALDVNGDARIAPLDACEIQVIIPKSISVGERFEAQTLFHCDQRGGLKILSCELSSLE